MRFSDMFASPLLMQIVLRALVVGVLVSLCCALLGVNLVLRRFSMIGDGLSHVGFGAIALAAVCGLSQWELEFTLPVVIVAAVLILRMSERSHTQGDAAIALLATGAVAVGSLLYNYSPQRNADICNSLFGSASVLTLTDKDLLLSLVLSAVVLALFILCYHKLFAITFDEVFARATGVHTQAYKTLLAVLTAVTIVLGMKLMGAIMISGLVVFPAMSAMRLCKSFRGVVLCSGGLAVVCFVAGFFTACRLSWQTGPTVIAVHTLVFVLVSASSALAASRLLRRKKV